MDFSTMKDKLYNAYDGDERKLKDRLGCVLVLRKVGWCECHRAIKCVDIHSNQTLCFLESSLREIKDVVDVALETAKKM